MFQVETYQNPVTYFNNLTVGYDELHLSSAPTLAMLLKDHNRDQLENIWIYHHFYNALYPKWNGVLTRLYFKRVLRNILEEYEDQAPKYITVLKKKISDVLDTFRFFIELGMDCIVANEKDGFKNQLLLQIYKVFCQHEELQEYFNELNSLETPEQLCSRLNFWAAEELEISAPKLEFIRKIYVYNLDYIEPNRLVFLQKLEQMGIEIIFRIPYYPTCNRINQGWKNIYEKLVPFEQWSIDDQICDPLSNNVLLDYLEGKEIVGTAKRTQNIHYHHFSEPTFFKEYLEQNEIVRNVREYVAFSDADLNTYFRDEILKNVSLQHFFETAAGKFIQALYETQYEEGKIRLDYSTYVKCMVSGWVQIDGTTEGKISGKDAVSLLQDLEPYMQGVQTLEEILYRIEQLKLLQEASSVFEDLARSKTDRNYVKRYLSNPLRVFSYVNATQYSITVNQLKELTEQFKVMIENLLSGYPNISVKDHFEKLTGYWEEIKKIPQQLQQQSVLKVYAQFEKALYTSIDEEMLATPEEIKELLYVLSCSRIEESEKYIDEPSRDGGDVILIKGIEHVIGLCAYQGEKLFFPDLSTINMNHYLQSRKHLTPFLSYELLEEYINRMEQREEKDRLLHYVRVGKTAEKNSAELMKFALFIAFTFYNGELHVGWIQNLNDYDSECNMLKIIKNLYGLEIQEVEQRLNEDELFTETVQQQGSDESPSIQKIAESLSPAAWKDLEYCDKKFYLSNIASHYPIYTEDFHQRLAFGHIAKMFEQQAFGRERVRQVLFPLFPQWSTALKENIVSNYRSQSLQNNHKFQNVFFPKDLIGLQILFSRRKQGEKRKEIQVDFDHLDQKEQWMNEWSKHITETNIPAQSGQHCTMCPHLFICKEGEFTVDRNR